MCKFTMNLSKWTLKLIYVRVLGYLVDSIFLLLNFSSANLANATLQVLDYWILGEPSVSTMMCLLS